MYFFNEKERRIRVGWGGGGGGRGMGVGIPNEYTQKKAPKIFLNLPKIERDVVYFISKISCNQTKILMIRYQIPIFQYEYGMRMPNLWDPCIPHTQNPWVTLNDN